VTAFTTCGCIASSLRRRGDAADRRAEAIVAMAGRAARVARQRHQCTERGDGGTLLLINGTLVGVGGVFLATSSVLVTGIAAAAAVALAAVVIAAGE
jgi:hypothetical protein